MSDDDVCDVFVYFDVLFDVVCECFVSVCVCVWL